MVQRAARRACAGAPLLVVDDTLAALEALGRAPRAQRTGPTSSRSPAASARPAPRKRCARRCRRRRRPMPATAASTTNGRAADARAHAARRRLRRVRDRHEPCRRDRRRCRSMVRPQVAIITTVEAAHIGIFPIRLDGIADAKAEIFEGLAGRRRRPQPRQPLLRAASPQRASEQGVSAHHRLRRASPTPRRGSSTCASSRPRRPDLRDDRRPRRQLPHRRARPALGAQQPGRARRGCRGRRRSRRRGRGAGAAAARRRAAARAIASAARRQLRADRRKLQRQPARRCARRSRCWRGRSPAAGGRRIAVLGDMLELGPSARAARRPGAGRSTRRVSTWCSPAARYMARLLRRAAARPCAAPTRRIRRSSCPLVLERSAPATSSLVKGSLGSRMGRSSRRCWRATATAMARRQRGQRHKETADRCCSISSSRWPTSSRAFNLFRYLTFRTGGAVVTALLSASSRPARSSAGCKSKQRKGQPIRTDGPESHLLTKKGTPTMGGVLILLALSSPPCCGPT